VAASHLGTVLRDRWRLAGHRLDRGDTVAKSVRSPGPLELSSASSVCFVATGHRRITYMVPHRAGDG
jgi:hypothetical protein